MKNTAKSLWASVLALVLCVSMLLGTTFAWFTDSVSSDRNTIAAGNLDVALEYLKDGAFTTVGSDTKVFDPNIKWEPGYTSLTCLRVTNAGTLALQYLLSITVEAGTAILGENGENLADVIKVYTCYGENTAADYEEIETSVLWQYEGTLTEVMRKPNDFLGGQLLPAGETPDANALATTKEKEQVLTVALHMEETAGNEYQKLSVVTFTSTSLQRSGTMRWTASAQTKALSSSQQPTVPTSLTRRSFVPAVSTVRFMSDFQTSRAVRQF